MDSASNVHAAEPAGSNCKMIDSDLYKAATEGSIQPFKEKKQDLALMVTPIKNTILHIHILFPSQNPKSTEFVKQILETCPSLLIQVNAKGDTPLHVAAKYGQFAIVKALIECAKAQYEELESGVGASAAKQQMLRMKNNKGNTALFEAVRNYYIDVVEILTAEDPEFSHCANDSGETPLFIAAQRGSGNLVSIILRNCKSAAHEGPGGKTALHAAVMGTKLDATRVILEKKKSLTKETDQNGWTPLHYAAYYDRFEIAKLLLQSDASAAYIVDKDRNMTALHMAAGQGYDNIMEAIISRCPDCCEMVDNRGWNVLHFAMAGLSPRALMNFLSINTMYKTLMKDLLHEKDAKGNTPLHVLAANRPETLTGLCFIPDVKNCLVFNKQNDSVAHINNYGSPELEQEIIDLSKIVDNGPYRQGIIRVKHQRKLDNDFFTRVEKAKDSQLVVAALIATVTFAAAFTMPGGFKSEGPNKGSSILTRNAAFQAFVITDALAMTLSLFAVFLHFCGSINKFDYQYLYKAAVMSTMLAMVVMVIAFVTGTYAVLEPSIGLAIATCLIGLSFFLLVACMQYKKDKKDLEAKP